MQNSTTTQRLLLDLITTADHAFITALVNSKGWLEFIGERNVHSEEDALAYINKILNTPDLYYWVVRMKEANTPVGIISFLKREYLENFDIGFAFLPEFSGKGFAYEAAQEIMSVVSTDPRYHQVLATTIPRNVNSIRLLTRLGLHFEKEITVGNEKLHVYTNAEKPCT